MSARPVLAVLGGSAVSTPWLLDALGEARASGALGPIEIRLWGRATTRLGAITRHGRRALERRGVDDVGVVPVAAPDEALDGAGLVLCQVRPGGMEGRARDERLAWAHGLPADEGLGPGGLAAFLRGRPVLSALAAAVRRHAPRATVLQMTSPLGLHVARDRAEGITSWGVCELPRVTADRVRLVVEPRLGPLSVAFAGSNHASWLHAFTDRSGADRTHEVLDALDDALVPAGMRGLGAVPVPYLRLFYERERVVAEQRARGRTRGERLLEWQASVVRAYDDDAPTLDALLAERPAEWYRAGVVPAVCAFLAPEPREIPLDLPGRGALPGIPPDAIVELPCRVSAFEVTPVAVAPLPPEPARLTAHLVAYERAVLELGEEPGLEAVAEVLALHPWIDGRVDVRSLAGAVHEAAGGFSSPRASTRRDRAR